MSDATGEDAQDGLARLTQDLTVTTKEAPQGESVPEDAKSTEGEVNPKENGGGVREEPEPVEETKVAAPPAKPKYRHDWYQTPTDVYINVMIKGLRNEDVFVRFETKMVNVTVRLSGETFTLDLSLAHPVVPERCTKKVLRTKLELKLRKLEGLQWSSLETPGTETLKQPSSDLGKKSDEDIVHKYPSSAHYTRNWDKLVADVKKEEKDEKLEGDAALNQLFQQIYKDGNDEVRKAMNKSFVESGGTVLSTNWGEVGKEKVERKPPDGMEWRDYEK